MPGGRDFIAALALLAWVTPVVAQTTVTVLTDPPGGVVQVAGQTLQHGQKKSLKPGRYEFVARLRGHRDGHKKVRVRGSRQRVVVRLGPPVAVLNVVTVPADAELWVDDTPLGSGPDFALELDPGGYQLRLLHPDHPEQLRAFVARAGETTNWTWSLVHVTEITITTDPAGGEVELGGNTVSHGETIEVLAGEHDVVVRKPGHRDRRARIAVDEEPREIVLALGEPFFTLTVEREPEDARLFVDDTLHGDDPTLELPVGQHRLRLEHSERYAQARVVEATPAGFETLVWRLPRLATLTLVAGEGVSAASIDGEPVDAAPEIKKQLPPGIHQVRTERLMTPWQRLVKQLDVTMRDHRGQTVTAIPSEEEWLFEGRWLPVEVARERERDQYESLRVTTPVHLRISTAAAWASDPDWGSKLHGMMRVGDRISFITGPVEWVLWKRSGSPRAAFQAVVAAIELGSPIDLPWSKDEARTATLQMHERIAWSTIGYQLARTRGVLPMLYAPEPKLNDSISIERCQADGVVWVIWSGQAAVSINGKTEDSRVVQLAPANGMVRVSWGSAPQGLVVLAERDVAAPEVPAADPLRRGEKRQFDGFPANQVQALTQTSFGPEYAQPRTDRMEFGGPLAGEMRLHELALGPNAVAGEYRRHWTAALENGACRSSRQLDVDYRVSEEALETESDQFLRRVPDS